MFEEYVSSPIRKDQFHDPYSGYVMYAKDGHVKHVYVEKSTLSQVVNMLSLTEGVMLRHANAIHFEGKYRYYVLLIHLHGSHNNDIVKEIVRASRGICDSLPPAEAYFEDGEEYQTFKKRKPHLHKDIHEVERLHRTMNDFGVSTGQIDASEIKAYGIDRGRKKPITFTVGSKHAEKGGYSQYVDKVIDEVIMEVEDVSSAVVKIGDEEVLIHSKDLIKTI